MGTVFTVGADIDDNETTSGMSNDHTDRRAALKKLAVGGAIAWSAPLLLSGVAHAAGGTAKCIPPLSSAGFGPGGGVLGTITFTYLGAGTNTATCSGVSPIPDARNFKWQVDGVVNYSIPALNPPTSKPCLCSATVPVVQFQWTWEAAYKSGKAAPCYKTNPQSSSGWTTTTGPVTYSKTFGPLEVQGNKVGDFGYSSAQLAVRVVCQGPTGKPAWDCRYYTASVSSAVLPGPGSSNALKQNVGDSITTNLGALTTSSTVPTSSPFVSGGCNALPLP